MKNFGSFSICMKLFFSCVFENANYDSNVEIPKTVLKNYIFSFGIFNPKLKAKICKRSASKHLKKLF